jgi:hypothetical protein
VQFATVRKRRSRAWRRACFVALFVFSAFIISDVLFDAWDVDDFQVFGLHDEDVIPDGSMVRGHAERFLRQDLPPADSPRILGLPLSALFRTNSIDTSSPPKAVLHIRHYCVLPRVNLHHEKTHSSSLSVDPA